MSEIAPFDSRYSPPDTELVKIADYVCNYEVDSTKTRQAARHCLMDAVGCALMALKFPACTRLLGPVVPGALLPDGVRVLGTGYRLEPVQAAFNIGSMIRWLDYNDTWLAQEWGHPSDNLGAILAAADYQSRINLKLNQEPLLIIDVLDAMVKAYEIQGVLALANSFNRVGLDHVLLVRVASTAVVTKLLGGRFDEIFNAISNAWVDGGCLRNYRHAPNTGSRKSWAAGDAASRAVRLALLSINGEMGYASALTTKTWGFYDVFFNGKALQLGSGFCDYVINNILFKCVYPAEFHAQTAVEAAIRLHRLVQGRLHDIDQVLIETQAAALRIIDKVGRLNNPADRDHCLQYMVAVALIKGQLEAEDYQSEVASDPRIDSLRKKIRVHENKQFSIDYLDPDKRSIANALTVFFNDGACADTVTVEYPLGHPRRRIEAMPKLHKKFQKSLNDSPIPPERHQEILNTFDSQADLESLPVNKFMDLFAINP